MQNMAKKQGYIDVARFCDWACSSIICSIYSKDTKISSSFISYIMFEVVADIVFGPDGSDVYVLRGKMLKNWSSWGISRAMVT